MHGRCFDILFMLTLLFLGGLLATKSAYAIDIPEMTPPPLWVFQGRPSPYESLWIWDEGTWSRIEVGEIWWVEDEVLSDLARRGWTDITIREIETDREIEKDGLIGILLEMASIAEATPGWEITAKQGPWRVTIAVRGRAEDDIYLPGDLHPYDDLHTYHAVLDHTPPIETEVTFPARIKWKPVPGSKLMAVVTNAQAHMRGEGYLLKTLCSPKTIVDHYTKTGDWAFYPTFESLIVGVGNAGRSAYYMGILTTPSDNGEIVYCMMEIGGSLQPELPLPYGIEYLEYYERQEMDW